MRHGLYPDPYVGLNNMLIPDACEEHNRRYNLSRYSHLPGKANPWAKPYWFRREFTLPDGYRGKVVWLHLDGINYRADVWLNGRQVADAESVVGMFRRFRFDVSQFLNPQGPNVLAVRIHPLDFPGDPFHEQLDGYHGSYRPDGGDAEILRNVTQYCSIGWDWIAPARDRNMGLWQHVWLEATGPAAIRDPAAMTDVRLPERDRAAVTIRCHLDNSEAKERKVELTARIAPDGFEGPTVEARTSVTLPPSGLTEVIMKPEDAPGVGAARAAAVVAGHLRRSAALQTHDGSPRRWEAERSSDAAIRRPQRRHQGAGQRRPGVYGQRADDPHDRRGVGARFPDELGRRRYRDEVRLMAEGNHTIVRVNGCGIVPPDVFFDACDRYGLLVWQDLSRTSVQVDWPARCTKGSPGPVVYLRKDGIRTGNPARCDPTIYLDNMKDCIFRLRGRSSLLLWCGSTKWHRSKT